MLTNILNKVGQFKLTHFIMIGIALIAFTFLFFPDRFPGQAAMLARMFLATVFIKVAYSLQPNVDPDSFPQVWACGLIGAGMSL